MSSALKKVGHGKPSAAEERQKEVNVQVVVRCRPKTPSDTHCVIRCTKSEVAVNPGKGHPKNYTFDAVFGEQATQKEIYDSVLAQMVDEVLKGFNCTIFAYGQTGTGKTYTMEGGPGAHMGVIPRSVNHIFEALENSPATVEWTVRVSYLEIYQEELRDLLCTSPANPQPLRIFDSTNPIPSSSSSSNSGEKITTVQNLEEIIVQDGREVMNLLANSRRVVAETNSNAKSSRSHAIFTVTIHIKESTPDGEDLVKVGKLNLVDLAGSENIGRSGAQGERKREAGGINQSLLTLGRVITALTEHSPHIPYRESKLTRLLQESLGGRAKTLIIATISPSASNLEETLSTLDYAHRAKHIRNKPEINARLSKRAVLREYTNEIDTLKAQLTAARRKDGVYLSEEMYQAMESKMQKQTEEITRLEETIEGKVKENSIITEELTLSQQDNSSLRKRVSGLEQQLSEAQQLAKEQAERISKLEDSECELQSRVRLLFESLRDAIDEIEALHSKLTRQQAVEEANIAARDAFLATRLEELVKNAKSRCGQATEQTVQHLSNIQQNLNILSSIENECHEARIHRASEIGTKAQEAALLIETTLAQHRDELVQAVSLLCEAQATHANRARELISQALVGGEDDMVVAAVAAGVTLSEETALRVGNIDIDFNLLSEIEGGAVLPTLEAIAEQQQQMEQQEQLQHAGSRRRSASSSPSSPRKRRRTSIEETRREEESEDSEEEDDEIQFGSPVKNREIGFPLRTRNIIPPANVESPAVQILGRIRALLNEATDAITEMRETSSKSLCEAEREAKRIADTCAEALTAAAECVELTAQTTDAAAQRRLEALEDLARRTRDARNRAREDIIAQMTQVLDRHLEEADRELEEEINCQLRSDIVAGTRAENELAQAVAAIGVDFIVGSEMMTSQLQKRVHDEWIARDLASRSSLAAAPIQEASGFTTNLADRLTILAARTEELATEFENQQSCNLAHHGEEVARWLRERGQESGTLGDTIKEQMSRFTTDHSDAALFRAETQIRGIKELTRTSLAFTLKTREISDEENDKIKEGVQSFCEQEIKETPHTSETPQKKKRTLNPALVTFNSSPSPQTSRVAGPASVSSPTKTVLAPSLSTSSVTTGTTTLNKSISVSKLIGPTRQRSLFQDLTNISNP